MTVRLDDGDPKTVLLDVDGTLCANTPRLIEYVRQECGIELTHEQITEWSFSIPGTDSDIGEMLHRRSMNDRSGSCWEWTPSTVR